MAADGYHGHCRPCYNEKQAQAVRAAPRTEPVTEGERACRKCTRVKPATDFLVDRRRRDGRATICRECNNAAVREIKSRDPQAQREADRSRKAAKRRHPD